MVDSKFLQCAAAWEGQGGGCREQGGATCTLLPVCDVLPAPSWAWKPRSSPILHCMESKLLTHHTPCIAQGNAGHARAFPLRHYRAPHPACAAHDPGWRFLQGKHHRGRRQHRVLSGPHVQALNGEPCHSPQLTITGTHALAAGPSYLAPPWPIITDARHVLGVEGCPHRL